MSAVVACGCQPVESVNFNTVKRLQSAFRLGMWWSSQNPPTLDADFICNFRQMRICHAIKISTSYYTYCDSTYR